MAGSKPKGTGGTMTLVIVVLLLTLVGAGAGLAVGTLILSKQTAEPAAPETPPAAASGEAEKPAESHGNAHGETPKETEDAAVEDEDAEEEIDPHALKVIPFPPVLTTLAEPKGKWIRLEGSILALTGGDQPPEILAERAAEQILTYLRSLRLDQLEGPSGVLGLRQDLNETVKSLSNGEVRSVLIHSLVVE